MKKLDDIILQYLKMKTNYAIVVSGEWGSGKTYYYENKLKNIITQTNLISDDRKKYTPILISLFGINSIEDIQTQIVLNLYPILKNRKTKLAGSIGKALFRGLLKMNNLNDYYEIVSEIEIEKKDWINFNELVIVFDDLERISKSLEIEEVIGFVNSLVEHDNVKVLLIANEDKIESPNYKKIKEKVVGITIEFIPNLPSSFDGLIKNYSGYSLYQDFLKENKDLILDFFSKASVNLRFLSFALDYFHLTYSETINFFISNPTLKNFEKDTLEDLLKFSIAITIEYKLGEISFKDRKDLDKLIQRNYTRSLEKKNQTEVNSKKPFDEIFNDKYYIGTEFNFYPSIYDYITGGNILDSNELLKEIKDYNNIDDEILPHHQQILKELTHKNFSNLSDTEYKIKTKLMLSYASQGKYNLDEYLVIFYFATRFSNILKLNIEKTKLTIIKGIRKAVKNCEHNPILERYLIIGENAEFKSQMEEIKAESLIANDKVKFVSEKTICSTLEKIYLEDFDKFYSEIFKKFQYVPILKDLNAQTFYFFFKNSKNSTKQKIASFIFVRYHDYNSTLKDEILFIEKLANLVEKKNKVLKYNKLSDSFFRDFEVKLDNALKRLRSY